MTRDDDVTYDRVASRRIAPSSRNRDITTPRLAPRRADDPPQPGGSPGGSSAAAPEVMTRGD